MKVKNIAFSGFAAAILMGVCGAANAATYQLASKDYVDAQVKDKVTSDQITDMVTSDQIEGMATQSDVSTAITNALNAENNGAIATAISAAVSDVESTATQASEDAAAAVQSANTASTKATDALNMANAANTAAGEAQTAAGAAQTTASEAKTTAEGAEATAGQAKTVADEAKDVATSAQEAATAAQNAVALKQDALTAGEFISITKDELTGETVIDSTYRYNDTQIKADIQANEDAIKLKASQADLESLQTTVQGKAETSTVTALSGRVSANETALSGKESVSNKLTGESVSADDLTAEKYMSALTVSKYVQAELEGALDDNGAVTDAVNTAIDNAVNNGAVNTAIQNAVADKASVTDLNALGERVDTVESDVSTLQTNSLSKETMGVGSFLVTNDGTSIKYTAIEIVAGDGVTNALNNQPLTK